MLFLNYFVTFRTDQTFVTNTHRSGFLFLFSRLAISSLAISKLTVFVLATLLVNILFNGEVVLSVLFSYNTTLNSLTGFSFLNETLYLSDSLLSSTTTTSTLTSLVILCTASALRFLFLLVL